MKKILTDINRLINSLNDINLNNKEDLKNNFEENKNSSYSEEEKEESKNNSKDDNSVNNEINSEKEEEIGDNEEVVSNSNIINEYWDFKDILSEKEDDKNINLYICSTNYYNISKEEENSGNYYKLPFKERLKRRKLEEGEKK